MEPFQGSTSVSEFESDTRAKLTYLCLQKATTPKFEQISDNDHL